MQKTTILRTTIIFCLLFLGVASAQAQLTGYPGKFVCGFQPGNVPFLSNANPFPHPYENFKPGNYATVFNVLNLNATAQSVSFLITLQNAPPINVLTININPFTSVEVGCNEIFNPFFPVPLNGQLIDSMMTVVATTSNLIVDAIYGLESQNTGSDAVGGLGLGASIDVVRIDPVAIPPAMLDDATDKFPPLGESEGSGTDG